MRAIRGAGWRRAPGTAAGVLLAALLTVTSASAGETDAEGAHTPRTCTLQSFTLDNGSEAAVLRIATDGRPESTGADTRQAGGVTLDLAGCVLGPGVADRSYPEGLVSTIELIQSSGAGGPATVVTASARLPFEYSVVSCPGSIRLRLSARPASSPDLSDPPRVRVLEPLPPTPPSAPMPRRLPIEPLPPPTDTSPVELRSVRLADDPQPAPGVFEALLEEWLRAWTEQRIDDYLSVYSASFRPSGSQSRPAWEAERRRRLTVPGFIEVAVDHVEVRAIASGRMSTGFWQSYRSDGFTDQVFKELIWTRENDRWKILEERADLTAEPESESPPANTAARGLVEGARLSVLKAPGYDPTYRVIAYPGGDPGWERGSGVDLVLRAFRQFGIDLQQRIHEDILASRRAYGIREPDPNIDHRRIRNLAVFLRHHAVELSPKPDHDWRPGDVVFWSLDGGPANHVGIVSDRTGPAGRLLVIHHPESQKPREEDVLFTWPIRAHFRWPLAQH